MKPSLIRRALVVGPLGALVALALPARADVPDGGPTPSSLANGLYAAWQDPTSSPPGANDFLCTPTAAHPRPVVLVHGTGAQMATNWRYLSPSLKAAGYCVFAFNYGGPPAFGFLWARGPVADSAQELSEFVDAVLGTTGASEVDIVGHSQGGLMPRWYLKFLGGAAKVHTLVGLSPSNHGTTFFGLTALSNPDYPPPGGFYDECGACADQQAGSSFNQQLDAGGDTVAGVDYTVIQTRYDEIVTPYTQSFLAGPNVTNILLQDGCELDFSDHLNIAFDPIARHHVFNALDPSAATPAPCQLVAPGVQ